MWALTGVTASPQPGGVWAAARNGHAAVVEALLGVGAAVDTADKRGETPLWEAASAPVGGGPVPLFGGYGPAGITPGPVECP